jgi:hypothetical protein
MYLQLIINGLIILWWPLQCLKNPKCLSFRLYCTVLKIAIFVKIGDKKRLSFKNKFGKQISTCFTTYITSLLHCILSNCSEPLSARILKESSFCNLFCHWFDKNGRYLGLCTEMGFNDMSFMGISHPAGTISEHFFHLCKAVNTKILKLHFFLKKNLISENIGTFRIILKNGCVGLIFNFL